MPAMRFKASLQRIIFLNLLSFLKHHGFMCVVSLLAQPSGSNIVVKVLWFVQWPFSLLRWMSIPPFGYVSVAR